MKKGALCILVLFLLAGFFPAARASVSGGFEYRLLDDGTAVITRYTADEAKPVIPSAINGIRVTAIGERAFANCRKLSSVKIPEGVRAIGDFAFWDCRGLISASIPGTVQTISFCAFSGCEKLRSVTIGEGVKKIGEEAFSFCYGLTSVRIPGSVTEIEQNAFLRCETLASVNIPNQARLNGNPFTACYRLKTISVSSAHPRYTLVDGVLFDKVSKTLVCYPGMRRDRTYEIPAGTEEIGAYAFGGGRNLKKVTGKENRRSVLHLSAPPHPERIPSASGSRRHISFKMQLLFRTAPRESSILSVHWTRPISDFVKNVLCELAPNDIFPEPRCCSE